MGTKGEEMRGFLLGGPCSPHALAIQRDRIIRFGHQSGLYPDGQNVLQGRRVELRQQPAVQGTAWSEKEARTKDLTEKVLVLSTPLTHSFAAIALTQKSGDQTGQQKGEIVAEAMASTRVRNGL